MNASVNIVTVRLSGLEWQLQHFINQTVKDFEIVLLDGYYDERKEFIAKFSIENNLRIKHHRLPKLNYMCAVNIASNRNSALAYSDGDVVIFIDDYEIVQTNFVEEHVKRTREGFATAGRQIALYRFREDYSDCVSYRPEEVEHGDGREAVGMGNQFGNGGVFWTNNASVWRKDALAINGFDERYNGGTAGEDTDFGVRLTTLGVQIYFSLDCEVWHIDHCHQPVGDSRKLNKPPELVDTKLCDHARKPFTVNAYEQGDYNLIEAGSLYTWRDALGIKYFICKNCGEIGHIDSIELVNRSLQKNSVIAPPEIFDCRNDRPDKVRSYVYWPIPKDILERLVKIYEGTQYTYYKDLYSLYFKG